jgi:hypothetical protein
MRFRELVETPTDETERRGRQQSGFTDLTRKGQALRPLYVKVWSAAIAIAWIEQS